MQLYHDFYVAEVPDAPSTPTELGEQANDQAKLAGRFRSSWLARKRQVKRQHSEPDFQKLAEASPKRRLFNFFGFAVFWSVISLEWFFQSPIYKSETQFGALLFWSLVGVVWFAGVCIGQVFPAYRIHLGEVLVDKLAPTDTQKWTRWRRWLPQWSLIHPLNGVIIFLGVEMLVLSLSAKRVAFEQTISATVTDTTLIPVFLYALELMLGIPAYWFVEWSVVQAIKHWGNHELSKAQLTFDGAVNKARGLWNRCLAAEREHNLYTQQHGLPKHPPIHQNRYLVALLREEYGEDEHTVPQMPRLGNDNRAGDTASRTPHHQLEPSHQSSAGEIEGSNTKEYNP